MRVRGSKLESIERTVDLSVVDEITPRVAFNLHFVLCQSAKYRFSDNTRLRLRSDFRLCEMIDKRVPDHPTKTIEKPPICSLTPLRAMH